MSAEAAASAPRCADCGAPAPGSYCGACGQETRIETPTVRHFLAEFIDQYIALEGKLGRTLRTLVTKPGRLTLDYLQGRRQRYVRPLKLYLTVSVIFFGLLGVLPDVSSPFAAGDLKASKDGDRHTLKLSLGDDADALAKEPPDAPEPETPVTPGKPPPPDGAAAAKDSAAAPTATAKPEKLADKALEKRIEGHLDAFAKLDHKEQNRLLRKKLADDAPYAMFFLLPYFALLLKWFYRREQPYYGAHLLFSIHLHCFVFILLALGFLPLPSILQTTLKLAVVAYLFFALRTVYGGSAKRTVWRMLWLSAFYLIAVGASAASGVINALLDAGSPA